MVQPTDDYPALNVYEAINVQQSVGNVLYYAREVDPKIPVTLKTIADEQSKNTQETAKKWCSFSVMQSLTIRQSPDTTQVE